MKIKAGELLAIDAGLGMLMEACKESTNNVFNYGVSRLISGLRDEIMTYRKQRDAVVMIYAKKDEKGKPVIEEGKYKFDDKGSEDQAVEELQDLENCEIDINVSKLTIDLNDDTIPPIPPDAFAALASIINVIEPKPLKIVKEGD